jgi:NitT/TauT family transport system substrate-binding protein
MGMKKVVSETSGAVFSLPWFVAKDQGFFAQEGIDMEFVDSLSVHVDQPVADPEKVDPILGHTPFEDNQVAIYRA